MSDPLHMDFEEPAEPKPTGRRTPKAKKSKEVIPVLPQRDKPLTGNEVRRGVSERGRAAANLKLDGFDYQEIADILEFRDARDAKREVERVLAATHSPEDWETLRTVATARAEAMFKESFAMARATHLIDAKTGKRIPNTQRLLWHKQASDDLMNHAIISGAKAPTKHEITPGEEIFEQIVDRILKASGHEEIMDAEVIDLDYAEPVLEIESGERDDEADA